MTVDVSKFGSISGKKYEKLLGDPVRVCKSEKVFSAGLLIDFGDPVRQVMDCIEQFSTRELVHRLVVSLYFVTRFLTVLVIGREVPAGAQLPWLPDYVSEADSLLACFESHEEALLDWSSSAT